MPDIRSEHTQKKATAAQREQELAVGRLIGCSPPCQGRVHPARGLSTSLNGTAPRRLHRP